MDELQHLLRCSVADDNESTGGQWNAHEQFVVVELDRFLLFAVFVLLALEHENGVGEQIEQRLFWLLGVFDLRALLFLRGDGTLGDEELLDQDLHHSFFHESGRGGVHLSM